MEKCELYKKYASIKKIILEQQPESEWVEDLIWCPSQLYLELGNINGNSYTLYLRWRGDDPWSLDLIKNHESDHTEWFN